MSSIKAIMTLALIIIVSLAFTGCSDDSSTVTQTAIDTAPPAVPAELAIAYNDGVVALSWAANTTDDDFDSFVVQRDYYGEISTLQTGAANTFQDSPLMGLNVYNVYSVDLAGNESAVASVEYHRIGDQRLPEDNMDSQF